MIEETKLRAPDDGDQVGECPTCGKYRKRIESGRMRPCYEWGREGEKKEKEAENE
jgi:hypothetical protein